MRPNDFSFSDLQANLYSSAKTPFHLALAIGKRLPVSKIVEDSLHLKNQLVEVYQAEDEKALLDGKELNILQKNDVNMHVVMIDWLVQFVRTYQELIKKLIG